MARQEFSLSSTQVSVFEALLRARKKQGGKAEILEDHDRQPKTFDDIVLGAFALGGQIKKVSKQGETVGVLLPTGVGCAVTFFAMQAAGRVPAMLNFTAGAMNLKAACAAAGITKIFTAQKFLDQGQQYQDLANELSAVAKIIKLEDLRTKIGLVEKIGALVASKAPRSFAHKAKHTDTAVILFTSGSFGVPRGVVLSHQNLVANVEQAASHIEFDPEWVFFNPLPMFHCFGLTGGALLPILTGHKAFLYPSPLHFKEIPKLVEETGANVLFATDTFAQQYARMSRAGELKGLKFAVLGAEKVREETREVYMKKFGVPLLEGYGATEASPVIAVNQPDANEAGSVGRVLPGMEVRLEEVPGIKEGKLLFVRGPNVMKGYLNNQSANGVDAPRDGWHDTGDIVTIDEQGFVRIQGRVKRFAKVGGEMVSLAAVESYAAAIWPEHRHAAVALPDPRKGERVVLVTDASEAQPGDLLAWAQKNGAPEIAVPKRVIVTDEIPVLGTGKTDYVAVQKIAEKETVAEAA